MVKNSVVGILFGVQLTGTYYYYYFMIVIIVVLVGRKGIQFIAVNHTRKTSVKTYFPLSSTLNN